MNGFDPARRVDIEVSIIVPAYNEEAVLGDCLRSLTHLDYPKANLEALIVDDGSSDKTAEIIRSFSKDNPNIKYLSKENGGKASAQNFGMKYAKGRFILITDADAVAENDWITRMLSGLRLNDIVIGSCYAKDPITWVEKMQQSHYLIKFKYGGLKGIPSVGVNNAFRRKAVNTIGNFDETSTSVTADFISRAKEQGLKILFDPTVFVRTKCTDTLSGFIRQKLRWREEEKTGLLSSSFLYTYGLSAILFGSLVISALLDQWPIFIITLIAIYFLSFSIYSIPFVRLAFSSEDRHYAKYFALYQCVELGIRFMLLPYIIFRFINPRKKPTFSARRG